MNEARQKDLLLDKMFKFLSTPEYLQNKKKVDSFFNRLKSEPTISKIKRSKSNTPVKKYKLSLQNSDPKIIKKWFDIQQFNSEIKGLDADNLMPKDVQKKLYNLAIDSSSKNHNLYKFIETFELAKLDRDTPDKSKLNIDFGPDPSPTWLKLWNKFIGKS